MRPTPKEWRPMTQEDWHELKAGDLIRLSPVHLGEEGLLLDVKQCHSAPWTIGAYRSDGKQPQRFYSLSHWHGYEVPVR